MKKKDGFKNEVLHTKPMQKNLDSGLANEGSVASRIG